MRHDRRTDRRQAELFALTAQVRRARAELAVTVQTLRRNRYAAEQIRDVIHRVKAKIYKGILIRRQLGQVRQVH